MLVAHLSMLAELLGGAFMGVSGVSFFRDRMLVLDRELVDDDDRLPLLDAVVTGELWSELSLMVSRRVSEVVI